MGWRGFAFVHRSRTLFCRAVPKTLISRFATFSSRPVAGCASPPPAVKKLNRDVWDFGWRIAHAAVSRRPPIPLDTSVGRTEGYTYATKVWDLSIVQGPFPVAPCPNANVSIRNVLSSLYPPWLFPATFPRGLESRHPESRAEGAALALYNFTFTTIQRFGV